MNFFLISTFRSAAANAASLHYRLAVSLPVTHWYCD